MSSMTIVDGVAQLVQEVQQKIDDGELHLSTEDRVRLDSNLEYMHILLAEKSISPRELEDAAWLLIAAFEDNRTLAKQFADRLAVLTGGTKLTGRVLPKKAQGNARLLKNKKIILDFTKWVKEKADNSRANAFNL